MISIVIPLYNKEKAIVGTLNSVLAQTNTDYEVIIVNDGSTDNSKQVVEDYIKSQIAGTATNYKSPIRLINKPNGGVSSARNRGIKEAKGEYIAFLDADDLWDKDYLMEQVRMMTDFPKAAMWGINFAEVTNGNQLVRRLATGLPDDYRGYVEDYFGLTKKGRISDLFCSSSVVVRKEVFDKVGYFDERIKYAEDTDMWWRIIARYPVAFYDRYMVFYQFDAENRALQKTIPLDKYLPYYVSKYTLLNGSSMYRYAMNWAANSLKRYMDDPKTRKEAICAGRRLDMSVLPAKYKFIFGLPTWLGYLFYKFTNWIKQCKYEK